MRVPLKTDSTDYDKQNCVTVHMLSVKQTTCLSNLVSRLNKWDEHFLHNVAFRRCLCMTNAAHVKQSSIPKWNSSLFVLQCQASVSKMN